MMPPKCYTWLESCGSQLSDGKDEKLFFCILQSVGFSVTLRTDIFLYTEKLSYGTEYLLTLNLHTIPPDPCIVHIFSTAGFLIYILTLTLPFSISISVM